MYCLRSTCILSPRGITNSVKLCHPAIVAIKMFYAFNKMLEEPHGLLTRWSQLYSAPLSLIPSGHYCSSVRRARLRETTFSQQQPTNVVARKRIKDWIYMLSNLGKRRHEELTFREVYQLEERSEFIHS